MPLGSLNERVVPLVRLSLGCEVATAQYGLAICSWVVLTMDIPLQHPDMGDYREY